MCQVTCPNPGAAVAQPQVDANLDIVPRKVCRHRCLVIVGHDRTTGPWRDQLGVHTHGTGHSKIVIGPDCAWEEHLDVIAESIVSNSGRSCINTSTVLVTRHGDALAEALARRLGDAAKTQGLTVEIR